MTPFVVELTDAQVKVVRRLDATKTVKQVLQTHVDTWLAPLVQELETTDRTTVIEAYRAASPSVRDQVRELLGLG